MAIITSPLIPLLIKEREYFRDEFAPSPYEGGQGIPTKEVLCELSLLQ